MSRAARSGGAAPAHLSPREARLVEAGRELARVLGVWRKRSEANEESAAWWRETAGRLLEDLESMRTREALVWILAIVGWTLFVWNIAR